MYPDPAAQSARFHERARRVIPDGVSRGTLTVNPYPIYAARGSGAWVTDVDGNRYLDANNNYTALILGHANPAVTAALAAQLASGTAFSFATAEELALAELLCERVPGFERIRFCNSGTEAVLTAIKAARGFTGRPLIAKFEGAYHGAYDWAEVSLDSQPANWGSPAAPAAVPYAVGTPASVAAEMLVLPYNDADAVRALIGSAGERLAAVVIDTLASRAGMPTPTEEFLAAVVEATRSVGALLIADEVITFRLGRGGHQAQLGLRPDLTTLGKIIGGGLPVGAVAGRADVMAVFEASGGARARVPAGGTFSANSLTMVAGRACLEQLDDAAFERLASMGATVRSELNRFLADADRGGQVTGEGSLFRLHPHRRAVRGYRDARHSAAEAQFMAQVHRELLNRSVYLTTYGMGCLSLAMTDADIELLVAAVKQAWVTTSETPR